MAKLDKIKEEIGWLKIIFAAFLAIEVSLIAWLAQNFENATIVLVILSAIGVIFSTVVLIGINIRVYKKLDEMENL